MDNTRLARAFSALAKLLEYRGENAFKLRSYRKVADLLRKGDVAFGSLSRDELLATEGIGRAIADKIGELVETGELGLYARLRAEVPDVVPELLAVKGIGVTKVKQLVEELGVASLGELQQAIAENRVAQLRGFSAKSQERLGRQLAFAEAARGRLRYADALLRAAPLLEGFRQNSPRVEYTGSLRRQCNVVAALDFLAVEDERLASALGAAGYDGGSFAGRPLFTSQDVQPFIRVFTTPPGDFAAAWLATTGSEDYLREVGALSSYASGAGDRASGAEDRAALAPTLTASDVAPTEADLFAAAGVAYAPAPQRELAAPSPPTPPTEVITPGDIRGVVHAHTTASDGAASLSVLAQAARERGYGYLTITDHSRAAGYANGLSVERLRAQCAEIDAYNAADAGIRVFKGTECDILRDGRLDYPDEVLSELDVVIASVHSVLTMSPEEATDRLVRAVENPYVTMLGHPTGRLLLSREGYAPDMAAVLDACARHRVAIEINASPLRLDLDWSYVPLAVERGIPISINPDAHGVLQLDNIRYGVYAAQKAGLRPRDCLNCLDADAFADYLAQRRRDRGLG